MALIRGYGCRFFDTSVDLDTVQVKSSVQLRGFSFENCRKSHFSSVPDAVPCLIVDGQNPHVVLLDGSISLCSLLSCQTQMCSHSVFVESCIESHCGARFVARGALCLLFSVSFVTGVT